MSHVWFRPVPGRWLQTKQHEKARKQPYLITWKLSLPQLFCQGPRARCLPWENAFPNWHLGLKMANETHEAEQRGLSCQCVQIDRAPSPQEGSCTPGNGRGQGRGADIQVQLDNHLQPCLTSRQRFDAIHQEPRCIWDISFPSLLKNFLNSGWREENKCPHSIEIYFSSNGGLTYDEVIPCETVLKNNVDTKFFLT